MRKLLLLLVLSISLFSCSDHKEKKSTEITTPTTTSPVTAAQDDAIEDWLAGKEWKSEVAAPFEDFKLFADLHMEYDTTTRYGWSYAKGQFGMHTDRSKPPLVTWPLQKVSDTTFTLYVEPTKKTFTYHFVSNL